MCQGLIAAPGEPPPTTLVPSISQITSFPVVVLYQRMSVLRSPSNRPVSATVHGLGAEPGEPLKLIPQALSAVLHMIDQITTCPVFVLCQRMPLLPSPLKSPVPTIAQSVVAVPGEPPPMMAVPFRSQITTCPLALLRQRMSVLPSLLKSPVP